MAASLGENLVIRPVWPAPDSAGAFRPNLAVGSVKRARPRSRSLPFVASTPRMTMTPIHVVGGGLAGSEAAWQIAQAGVPVVLHEMRPVRGTDAHQTDKLAELVCSNSFQIGRA